MALSRSEAEALGVSFSHEDDFRSPADPDQPLYLADLTIDGHTEHFQGKSEEGVLAQAEAVLRARGRIQADEPEVVERESLAGQKVDEPGSGYVGAPDPDQGHGFVSNAQEAGAAPDEQPDESQPDADDSSA